MKKKTDAMRGRKNGHLSEGRMCDGTLCRTGCVWTVDKRAWRVDVQETELQKIDEKEEDYS